jgi:hypothetical protein
MDSGTNLQRREDALSSMSTECIDARQLSLFAKTFQEVSETSESFVFLAGGFINLRSILVFQK